MGNKRALRRALRLPALTGACWNRGQHFTRASAAGLAAAHARNEPCATEDPSAISGHRISRNQSGE
eukprot:1958967-Pyramimonas_sp.AAC.1